MGKKAGKFMNKKQMGEILEAFFKDNPSRTYSFKDIFRELNFKTHPLKMLAIDVMEEMAWDDFLHRVTDTSYRLAESTQIMEGVFMAKANGRNSFLPDGTDKPIFVAERNSLFAMDGDRVRVSMMARRRNHIREAQVIEIIERAKDTFVGKLTHDDELYILIPRDNIGMGIVVPKRKLNGAKEHDHCVVKVIAWPDNEHRSMVAEVIDVLGEVGDNTAEMHAILAQYGLPYSYPKEVEEAADRITGEITEQDYAEREDFRDVYTCTIDPHDAKDFDDALSIAPLQLTTDNGNGKDCNDSGKGNSKDCKNNGKDCKGNLWQVGVHIADVSHYVTEGSIIDKEARERATSVYLVDRTIPMLPEHLCNFVCSLRPDEEKLAYSVIFTLDDDANIKDYRIVHTVIKSNRRFTYEEVQAILEQPATATATATVPGAFPPGTTATVPSAFPPGFSAFPPGYLHILNRLAQKLRARRFDNGAVKFDREEMRFDIDANGKPTRCYFKRATDATKLVEEFMLLANRTVAEHIGRVPKGKVAKTLPYRVHDNPDPQKFESLKDFVVKFGYRMGSTGTKGAVARSLNKLMDECIGKPEGNVIQLVALRAMMKAKYTVHNIGHFGLAFDYYTHFTSPIRRYPDTMVHRLLTEYEKGAKSASKDKYEELCEHSSDMEQIAANAERDSIKYKMVEFMAQYVGEEFDAHISGITSYGIYCEIDENHCEGMVPMRDLDDDYYEFDEKNFCLVGRRRHTTYQLGDPIRIKVARANIDRRQLDFVPA